MDALTREPDVTTRTGRGRRRWLIALAVLVTAAAAAAIWYWPVASPEQKAGRSRDAGNAIPVVVEAAAKRDMPIWLDGLGTVQAFQTVTVKSMADGPLVAIAFKEGQLVHKGEVLARIDPRIYQAALDNATAKKALDEATLANARLDFARYQKLVVTNYATQQQADTSKAQVAQLEAQVRQDQAQIDSAQTQLSYTTIVAPLDGIVGMRQVDQGNIVHASDSSGLAVITQLQPISVVFNLPQQNLAQVAAAQLAVSGQGIGAGAGQGAAPAAQGTTAPGAAGQGAGQETAQGAAVQGTASGTAQGVAQGTAAQGTAGPGTAGQGTAGPGTAAQGTAGRGTDQPAGASGGAQGAAGPEVIAYMQGGGVDKPLDRGTLTVLDNQIDSTTGTIRLKATFPNTAGTLWPGGFVGIRLRADTARGATVVPQAAVQRGPRQSFVFVIDQDNVAHRVNVTLGYEDVQGAIVTSGVNPGDRVVIDGASRLSDGGKVTLAQPESDTSQGAPNRPAAPGTRPRRGSAGGGGAGGGG